MATLATLRTEISAILGLDTTDSAELALIDSWINEGVADIVRRTQCKVIPGTMTLTSGQDDYTLSTDVLQFVDMYLTSSSNNYSLEHVTPAEILNYRRSFGTSTQVSPSRLYAIDGGNLLMVYPTPSAADVISFTYVPRPAALANSASSPSEIPTEFHKLVVTYGLARGADYDDDTTSEQGQRYLQQYEFGIRDMRKSLNQKAGKLARIRVNWRRREIVSPDPSRSYR